MKLAAIDIGSNAIRLLIAEMLEVDQKAHISKLSLVRLPIRLGSDVFLHGKVSDEKRREFIKGIGVFKSIAEIHGVKGLIAAATSAMRTASNGDQIVAEVKKETGIDIQIIDGDKEADIILSTFHFLSLEDNTPYLYIDVGGGSTEISLLINGKAKASHSFKVGTVRMMEDIVEGQEWEGMKDWTLDLAQKYAPKFAIGSGGNINKIIKLCNPGNEMAISWDQINDLKKEMESVSFKERMVKWDLRSDRADVIIPASNIYLSVMKKAGITEIIVPKIGLSDGLIYHLYKEQKVDNSIS